LDRLGRSWQVWAINAVAQVKCQKKTKTIADATGFFYKHKNQHVVVEEKEKDCPDKLRLRLHTDKTDLSKNKGYSIPLYDKDGSQLWLEHPTHIPQVAV
jgi:hypothetical protein